MVLGYSNFFEFSESDRAAYRVSLESKSIPQLRQLELQKNRALFSSCFTVASGAAASTFTSGGALLWSGVGWRKGHVAYRKRQMIREQLLRYGEEPHHADLKDFGLTGGAWMTGNVLASLLLGLDVPYLGGGSTVAEGAAIAGGDIASSAAKTAAEEASQALQGDTSVQDGFEKGEELVPEMQKVLGSTIENSAGPGLEYLTTDPGLHNLGNLGSASVGSTAAFVLKEGISEVIAETTLKTYSHTFEADKSAPTSCKMAASPRPVICKACSNFVLNGPFMHCCACHDDSFDLCTLCYDKGRRCECAPSSGPGVRQMLAREAETNKA